MLLEENFIDDTESQDQQRRLGTYSMAALESARELDQLYILHPDFKNALESMKRIHTLAPKFDMGQGMVITGPAGVGKTSIFKYFCKSLPNTDLLDKNYSAVAVRLQKNYTAASVIRTLLEYFGHPFTRGTDAQLLTRRNRVIDYFIEKQTQLLFIDEAGGLLEKKVDQGNRFKLTFQAAEIADLIREVMDACRAAVVLSGISTHTSLASIDEGLSSRMTVFHEIKPFVLNGNWISLLGSMSAGFTAHDSSIIKRHDIAALLHSITGGNLRNLKRLLIEAVLISIDKDDPSLSLPSLSLALKRVHGSNPKSQTPFDQLEAC